MPINTGASEFLAANLVGNCLFGIYIYIIFTCSSVFYEKFKAKKANYYQFATFIMLTVLCAVRVVVDNIRTMYTWTHPLPDGTVMYPDFGANTTVLLAVMWIAETITADAYIIYRLWIVWGSWTILPIPVTLLFGCLATGIYFLYVLVAQKGTSAEDFLHQINSSSISVTATTLALNIFCTSVIGWKIYWMRRATSGMRVAIGKDPLQRFVIAILESAAIYTAILLAALITMATDSFVSYAIFPLLPPVIAIVFGLIIIRSSMGIAVGESDPHVSSTQSGSSNAPSSNSGSSVSTEIGVLPPTLPKMIWQDHEVNLDRSVSPHQSDTKSGKEEV